MKATLWLTVLLAGLALAYPGEVIHQIPAPGGHPDGLTWVDGYLWITSDADMQIYKVDPSDGAIVDQIDVPGPNPDYPTGLTWNGTHLVVTVKPWKIYFVDISTGMAVDSIPTPSGSNNEGLTWDGTHLWSTNFSNNVIYRLDPNSGDIIEWFQPFSPGGNTGLAWDGYNLFVSMQNTQLIYVMLPMVPQPITYYMAPCDTPQDMTWDGEYLWITEYEEFGAQIYQMDAGTQHLSPATWARVKTVFVD